MRTIPRKEAIKELNRELKMRQGVYPRWIGSGKLSKHHANNQFIRMEMARDILTEMTDKEYQDIIDRAAAKAKAVQTRLDI